MKPGVDLSKAAIWVVVVLHVALATTYSLVTPIMEASDELWHYPMVKYIADRRRLPVQDPANVGPWRQEGSQAPLYYLLSAALTAWIDTSDMPEVRRINPHADSGIVTADGNINLIVHTDAERFPWRGTTLAIHLIRLMSVCMSAGTVYLTYRLVTELWPERHGLGVAAAAITAFNPMFCFIGGAVNNDNLATLLSALGLWLLVRQVRVHDVGTGSPPQSWWGDCVVLGCTLGAAVLTKSQALGLLPLTALAVTWVAWRRRSWHMWVSGAAITAGLVAVISGWWFVRNAILYEGDWMGIERFIQILGYRVPPATLRQLWGERQGFLMAYWGLFGGVNVPMPGWTYRVLNGALVAGAAGLVLGAARAAVRWARDRRAYAPVHVMQVALVALWPVVVVVLWAAWAVRTWSSQGRLVFAAMSAWSTWLAYGLSQLVPGRYRHTLPGAVGALLLGLAAWAPIGAIAPAYVPPVLASGSEPDPATVVRADVGGQLRLLGYDLETRTVYPGDEVRFALYWEAQQRMARDWSVFCHLVDLETGLHVATRDRYPGQGLLATSTMTPGLRWVDRYVVRVPETAYAPSQMAIEVGLYDGDERPPIVIERGGGTVIANALRLDEVLELLPREGDVPNPTHVNFEDRLALVGWDVDRRVVPSGQALELVLYWTCLDNMDETYTVSAQIVTPEHVKAAQSDLAPGGVDTATCRPGQHIVDRRTLTIADDATAGGYDIRVSVYGWRNGVLYRLRLIDQERRVLSHDSLVPGQIRIVP